MDSRLQEALVSTSHVLAALALGTADAAEAQRVLDGTGFIYTAAWDAWGDPPALAALAGGVLPQLARFQPRLQARCHKATASTSLRDMRLLSSILRMCDAALLVAVSAGPGAVDQGDVATGRP